MPLNLSFSGRTFPPTDGYLVSREKIREFADAIGAGDAAYRDPAAARALGHPDVIAPPTFPVVITMPVGKMIADTRELGLDYSRVVHGDQRFAYVRPVVAGDRLSCASTVEKVASRAGLDSILIRMEITADGGDPVVTVWTTLIGRTES